MFPVVPPIQCALIIDETKNINPRFNTNRKLAKPLSSRPKNKSFKKQFYNDDELTPSTDHENLVYQKFSLLSEINLLQDEVSRLSKKYDEVFKSQCSKDEFDIEMARKFGQIQEAENLSKISIYSRKITKLQNELNELEKLYARKKLAYSAEMLKQIQSEVQIEKSMIIIERHSIQLLNNQLDEEKIILINEDLRNSKTQSTSNCHTYNQLSNQNKKIVKEGKDLDIQLYTLLKPRKTGSEEQNTQISFYQSELEKLKALRIKKQKQIKEKEKENVKMNMFFCFPKAAKKEINRRHNFDIDDFISSMPKKRPKETKTAKKKDEKPTNSIGIQAIILDNTNSDLFEITKNKVFTNVDYEEDESGSENEEDELESDNIEENQNEEESSETNELIQNDSTEELFNNKQSNENLTDDFADESMSAHTTNNDDFKDLGNKSDNINIERDEFDADNFDDFRNIESSNEDSAEPKESKTKTSKGEANSNTKNISIINNSINNNVKDKNESETLENLIKESKIVDDELSETKNLENSENNKEITDGYNTELASSNHDQNDSENSKESKEDSNSEVESKDEDENNENVLNPNGLVSKLLQNNVEEEDENESAAESVEDDESENSVFQSISDEDDEHHLIIINPRPLSKKLLKDEHEEDESDTENSEENESESISKSEKESDYEENGNQSSESIPESEKESDKAGKGESSAKNSEENENQDSESDNDSLSNSTKENESQSSESEDENDKEDSELQSNDEDNIEVKTLSSKLLQANDEEKEQQQEKNGIENSELISKANENENQDKIILDAAPLASKLLKNIEEEQNEKKESESDGEHENESKSDQIEEEEKNDDISDKVDLNIQSLVSSLDQLNNDEEEEKEQLANLIIKSVVDDLTKENEISKEIQAEEEDQKDDETPVKGLHGLLLTKTGKINKKIGKIKVKKGFDASNENEIQNVYPVGWKVTNPILQNTNSEFDQSENSKSKPQQSINGNSENRGDSVKNVKMADFENLFEEDIEDKAYDNEYENTNQRGSQGLEIMSLFSNSQDKLSKFDNEFEEDIEDEPNDNNIINSIQYTFQQIDKIVNVDDPNENKKLFDLDTKEKNENENKSSIPILPTRNNNHEEAENEFEEDEPDNIGNINERENKDNKENQTINDAFESVHRVSDQNGHQNEFEFEEDKSDDEYQISSSSESDEKAVYHQFHFNDISDRYPPNKTIENDLSKLENNNNYNYSKEKVDSKLQKLLLQFNMNIKASSDDENENQELNQQFDENYILSQIENEFEEDEADDETRSDNCDINNETDNNTYFENNPNSSEFENEFEEDEADDEIKDFNYDDYDVNNNNSDTYVNKCGENNQIIDTEQNSSDVENKLGLDISTLLKNLYPTEEEDQNQANDEMESTSKQFFDKFSSENEFEEEIFEEIPQTYEDYKLQGISDNNSSQLIDKENIGEDSEEKIDSFDGILNLLVNKLLFEDTKKPIPSKQMNEPKAKRDIYENEFEEDYDE